MTVIAIAFVSIIFKTSNNANNSKARPGLIKVKDDLSDRGHRHNRPKSWRVEVRVSAVGGRRERVVHLARSCHALLRPWMSLSCLVKILDVLVIYLEVFVISFEVLVSSPLYDQVAPCAQ